MADRRSITVEFLDADDGVFRDSDAAAFADPSVVNGHQATTTANGTPSRARWVVPAFAALFALIAASIVVAVAAHSREGSATAITAPNLTSPATTAAPTSLGAAPTLALEPPAILADAPAGFTFEYVERAEPVAGTIAGTIGGTVAGTVPSDGEPSMELWATPEALMSDSAVGLRAWFSVTRRPLDNDGSFLVGAYRMIVGDVEVRVAPPTTQRTTTAVEFVHGRQLVHIDSFGWYARPLQKLIAFIAGGGSDYSTSFVATDHVSVYQGPPRTMIDLATSVWQTTRYVDRSTGFERSLLLTVGAATAVWPAATTVALTDRTDLVLRISGFEGSGVFGRSIDEPGANVLQWVVNGWLLTARGPLSRDELVAFAESSYAATQEQYERFLAAVTPPSRADFIEVSTDLLPLTPGLTLDSFVYTAELIIEQSPVERRASVFVRALSPLSGYEVLVATLPADRPMIQSIADGSMTLVVASAPVASPATHLRLNVTGSDPVTIALASIAGVDDPRVATAFFTTAAPFTAQLMDAAGTILLNWPDTAAPG